MLVYKALRYTKLFLMYKWHKLRQLTYIFLIKIQKESVPGDLRFDLTLAFSIKSSRSLLTSLSQSIQS